MKAQRTVTDQYVQKVMELDSLWVEFIAALVGCDRKAAREKHILSECRRYDIYGELDVALYSKLERKFREFFGIGKSD